MLVPGPQLIAGPQTLTWAFSEAVHIKLLVHLKAPLSKMDGFTSLMIV